MTFNISASISRIGKYAARGADYEIAYGLWADSCNARGGVLGENVAVQFLDDESDPETASTNIHGLKGDPKVVLGPSHTRTAGAAINAAAAVGRIMLQATHGAATLFDNGGTEGHFLCWPGCDADYPAPFVQYVVQELGPHSRVALLRTNGRIGKAVAKSAREMFVEKAVAEPTEFDLNADIGEVGIRTAAAKAMENHDAILACLDHARQDTPTLNILRTAQQLNFPKGRIWLSDHPSATDLQHQELYEGVWMRTVWWPDFPGEISQKFHNDFTKTAGRPPSFHAAGAFACGEVLEQAAQSAGSLDREALQNALLSIRFETIFGAMRFDATGRPNSNIKMGQWRDGTYSTCAREGTKP